MKKLLFGTCIWFIFCSLSYAEGEKWTSLVKNESIEIQTQTLLCDRPDQGTSNEYRYIKVINLTNKKIKVQFDKEIWFNNECHTCGRESEEYTVTVTLNPKQETAGNCNDGERALEVFSRMPSGGTTSVLTGFKANNIRVTEIER